MCVCMCGGRGYGRAEESRKGQKERRNKGIAIWEGAEGEGREGVGIRRKERRRGEVEETGEGRLEGGGAKVLAYQYYWGKYNVY